MKISIVTTLYNSELFIDAFYYRSKTTALKLTEDYEIIIIDDGSPDQSYSKAVVIANQDPRVTVVKLAKNFGHHRAMMQGLRLATGDYIFAIDSDLEEDPELLWDFYHAMKEQQCDAIYGVQRERKGGFFERIAGKVFYKIMNFLSEAVVDENVVTARLMSKKVVDAINQYDERVIYMHGIWQDVGFNQKPYLIKKSDKGATDYTLKRKVRLAVDSITSFSSRPLYLAFLLGSLLFFSSFICVVSIIAMKIFFGFKVLGWASVITSIWMFSGLNLLFIGIVGIYLSKIFIEIKKRPYTLFDQVALETITESSDDDHNKLCESL